MTSPQAAEFQRRKSRAAMKRSRLRKAGLLPPLPICPRCGAKCCTDRWLPLCSICARRRGHDPSRNQLRARKHEPRPLRLAAEQILAELRAEARQVTDCDSPPAAG
jgi:ribosomal protein L32